MYISKVHWSNIVRNRKEWKQLESVKTHNKNSRSHGLAHHVNSRLSNSLLGGGPRPACDIRDLFIYLFISNVRKTADKTIQALNINDTAWKI